MRVVFERNAFCLQELSLSLGSAKGEPLADVPIGKHDAMAWDDARSGVRVQRVSNLAGAARCAHERRHLAIRCHASARDLLDNLVYALEEALVPARTFFCGGMCIHGCSIQSKMGESVYTASDLPIVPRAHDIARLQLPRMGTDHLKGAAISSQLMKRARGMSIMGMSFGSQEEPLLGEVVYVGNTHSEHPRSGLAISGLIVGILALITSLLPIINNISFFAALVGAVLAIVGLVSCLRGKRGAKGLAIAAVAVNVVAIVAVLVSQSMYSSAIDSAVNGPQAVASSKGGTDSKAGSNKEDEEDDAENLAVGSKVELANGVTVSVDEIVTGLVNYDGTAMTGVCVTYVNNSDKTASFNSYDWKGESSNGVQSDSSYYSEATEDLSYGDLSAGGTVTGFVYFEGDLARVLYYSSAFSDAAAASWKIS